MNEVYARGVEVAGTHFRYSDALDFLNSERSNINLVLEPTNKFDKNAIKVMWGHRHIGYVPAPLAKRIYTDKVQERVQAFYLEGYLEKAQNNKVRLIFDILLAAEPGKEVLE